MWQQRGARAGMALALVAGALWGCEPSTPPAPDAGAPPAMDAGKAPDAAPPAMDVGKTPDAASAMDAGKPDAAPAMDAGQDAAPATDAGGAQDVGSAQDAGATGGGLLPDPNFMLRGPELRSPDEAKGNLLGGGDKKEPRLLDVDLKGSQH